MPYVSNSLLPLARFSATASMVAQWLPNSVRRPAEQLQILLATGLLSKPFTLARQWRHRRTFLRIQKALLYHRYATALLLGHETGVFDALAKKPRTVRELAQTCGIHVRAADALTRILESEGMLGRQQNRFTLTHFAKLYMTPDAPFTIAPMLDLMAAQAASFGELPRAMAGGSTPKALDIFSPKGRYRAFLNAVNEYLSWATKDLLFQIQLPPIRSFIAGSMGVAFSAELLRRMPEARVTYGCLEHLTREIPRLVEKYGVPRDRVDGIHCHGGNPSEDTWGSEDFDLVFLTKKFILVPEAKMGEKFAAKAFEVLRPGGVAIFWETVHPAQGRTPLARAMEAVLDLGASPAGIVNTDEGMRRTLKRIGYRHIDIVPCLGGQTTFVVARKAN